MNKKGIIAIIVIIVLIVIGFMIWGGKGSTVSNPSTETASSTTVNIPAGVTKDTYAPVTSASTDSSLLGRLKNASVSAAEMGNRTALVNGKATFTDGAAKGTITLGNIAVAKTLGSTNYVLTDLAVNAGGSGTFWYVVLFEDKNGTLTDKSYAVIGDRVNVTGIRADQVVGNDGTPTLVVSVSYMDRPQTDPKTAAPSIPRTKILVVENGEFNTAKEIDL